MSRTIILTTILWLFLSAIPAGRGAPAWKHFRGMCDASAVEMLTDDLFVVGNDEDNVLRVFSRKEEGLPVQALDFSPFYKLKKRTLEIDLEGAARIGNRIYWISSHGANAKGKFQPTRHRLFATEVISSNGAPRLQTVGKLYTFLLRDLFAEPSLNSLNLRTAALKAPKERNALNIEGLASTAEGHLLIGFRNPNPGGKALLVPLRNPDAVTLGQKAEFGPPILIDLEGLGIRSITSYRKGYLIVAGSYDGRGSSPLYFWDGATSKPAPLIREGLPGNPEGISLLQDSTCDSIFVLSDDGTLKIGGVDCKKLKNDSLKTFRGYELPLPPL